MQSRSRNQTFSITSYPRSAEENRMENVFKAIIIMGVLLYSTCIYANQARKKNEIVKEMLRETQRINTELSNLIESTCICEVEEVEHFTPTSKPRQSLMQTVSVDDPETFIIFHRENEHSIFKRNFTDYVNGFFLGNGDGFIGLEGLKRLTNDFGCSTLEVATQDLGGKWRINIYAGIHVGPAPTYTMNYRTVQGDSSDPLFTINRAPFVADQGDCDDSDSLSPWWGTSCNHFVPTSPYHIVGGIMLKGRDGPLNVKGIIMQLKNCRVP